MEKHSTLLIVEVLLNSTTIWNHYPCMMKSKVLSLILVETAYLVCQSMPRRRMGLVDFTTLSVMGTTACWILSGGSSITPIMVVRLFRACTFTGCIGRTGSLSCWARESLIMDIAAPVSGVAMTNSWPIRIFIFMAVV